VADARAGEAEELRDRLGQRADQLEAVNRVSRALASSLEQDKALDRFLRELSGVFEFERLAIVLVDGDEAVVMANAGLEAEGLYARGTARPAAGSVIEDVARESQTIVRGDMDTNPQYPEEKELARAGLRSRVVAPLAPGGQFLGMLSVSRSEADAFTADEADLITMLAQQVGFAVQNMRSYAAERNADAGIPFLAQVDHHGFSLFGVVNAPTGIGKSGLLSGVVSCLPQNISRLRRVPAGCPMRFACPKSLSVE